jgi:hypothetical protein
LVNRVKTKKQKVHSTQITVTDRQILPLIDVALATPTLAGFGSTLALSLRQLAGLLGLLRSPARPLLARVIAVL